MMKGQKGYVRVQKLSLRGVSWRAVWRQIARWRLLVRERTNLAGMSDDMLKDLGLSRADVEREAVRHFWDDPLRK